MLVSGIPAATNPFASCMIPFQPGFRPSPQRKRCIQSTEVMVTANCLTH